LFSQTQKADLLLLIGIFLLIFGVRLDLIDALSYITPYYDDWREGGFLQLYASGELTLKRMFEPFNGHIAVWSNLINFFFFELNQDQWDPRFKMVVNASIWALSGSLMSLIALQNRHSLNAPVLISIILLLWLFPSSVVNAFWGVQTHNYLMIFLSVAAIWLSTAKPWSLSWYCGAGLAMAVPLTMGGGALVSLAILSFVILKIILQPQDRKENLASLAVWIPLALFSLFMLKHLSGGHDIYYAESIKDFLTTLFKALSFPLSDNVVPSIVILLPILVLLFRAIQHAALNHRLTAFALSMVIYTGAIALAIGYARGRFGGAPSERYFEFLSLNIVTSAIALMLIQKQSFQLRPLVNTALILAWVAVLIAGGIAQVERLDRILTERAIVKPAEEDAVRRYMTSGDIAELEATPISNMPFPSASGLEHFIEKLKPHDLFPHQLQVRAELSPAAGSTGFERNAAIRISTQEFRYKYRHENVVGSFIPRFGGVTSTGQYLSNPIHASGRNYLMVPVMGYLGYPGLSLSLVDEVTGAETPIAPEVLDSAYAESWQEIYVKAPQNAFRLKAVDDNDALWFGFAAPRTVGRVSMFTKKLLERGHYVWWLGLLLIVFTARRSITKWFSPGNNNSAST